MGIEQFRIFFWRKKTPPPTIWPPMNPRWVRSETIFDDETLTTAEGNGMQWAGQWSGYYPPTLCKLCNYVLGKLFVRFFYAVDDRGITHQPLTKLCKISFWGNYLSDFSRQCIMLPTNCDNSDQHYANKMFEEVFLFRHIRWKYNKPKQMTQYSKYRSTYYFIYVFY